MEESMKCLIHGKIELVFVSLVVLLAALLVILLKLTCTIGGAARREMNLRARLIEQMEATRQAERKSMRKSKAIAEASHNIRTSLACLSTLIESSYWESGPVREVRENLREMKKCASMLLGILNSILDTSKIEAGVVMLDDEDFDLVWLLEDSIDLFHQSAAKKNVDLVFDLTNGSVLTYSQVRGDKGKLNQILSNLLHNAVKFTDGGHISVRVWARRTSSETRTSGSNINRRGWWRNLRGLMLFGKGDGQEVDVGMEMDRDLVEFVFEVDDTGKGIPKEKWKSVFEDYNQIRDGSSEQGGTGLGLGSVQSLVRLMGGDIKIVDKGIGEKGTCFRFNVILTVRDNLGISPGKSQNKEDIETGPPVRDINPWPCLTIRTPNPGRSLSIRGPSSRQGSSPRPLGSSSVVLLMGSDERRRVLQRFLERLGINVRVGRVWTDLPSILRRARRGPSHSRHSSSGMSNASLSRAASNGSSRSSSRSPRVHDSGGPRFLLLIIDTGVGPFDVLVRLVREFQRGIQYNETRCMVVWLDNTRRITDPEGEDVIFSRPLHGSRLVEVIRLLPEFGGHLAVARNRSLTRSMREARDPNQTVPKPLTGKRALVVEDNRFLRFTAKAVVSSLGADVEVCENGEQAVSVFSGGVAGRRRSADGASSCSMLPYDFILMDCQMPEMDGYEATRRIREEEKRHGVRTPIIALTAHSAGPELKAAFEAGMDSYLQKPLNIDKLVEVLRKLNII